MTTAENEIKLEVGELRSARLAYESGDVLPFTIDVNELKARIDALDADVLSLLRGLELAGRQIDDLRKRLTSP